MRQSALQGTRYRAGYAAGSATAGVFRYRCGRHPEWVSCRCEHCLLLGARPVSGIPPDARLVEFPAGLQVEREYRLLNKGTVKPRPFASSEIAWTERAPASLIPIRNIGQIVVPQ